ncbi:hypothetical protein F5X68DRAFT_30381 [Plectosphaerella plurivora]|uniref:Uncharacterized protein n=1 Tax=Plectosphaerella plurivora TaxID=936078 RepID=A0A9P9AHG0_9PEZI|nr:hypothetical protein F5X68DRAFT_30381 [Plectosphaerella plurivora]
MASVVQKLDDDEFHLTTLPLDKVLQLQKWLVFQCCRPLECPKCNNSPSVHTLLLIVCDRLTEMFDCTSRRLKRIRVTTTGGMAMQALSNVLGGEGLSKSPSEPFNQLYCSVSGSPADQTECTPVIFSDDLHGQYTEEEQVHMIRGIISLHVGYFRRLLLRIEGLSQVGGNKARLSRISSIITRLDAAAVAIELAFQGILTGERVEP